MEKETMLKFLTIDEILFDGSVIVATAPDLGMIISWKESGFTVWYDTNDRGYYEADNFFRSTFSMKAISKVAAEYFSELRREINDNPQKFI